MSEHLNSGTLMLLLGGGSQHTFVLVGMPALKPLFSPWARHRAPCITTGHATEQAGRSKVRACTSMRKCKQQRQMLLILILLMSMLPPSLFTSRFSGFRALPSLARSSPCLDPGLIDKVFRTKWSLKQYF